jgi:predicted O-methyltransferase YrrM
LAQKINHFYKNIQGWHNAADLYQTMVKEAASGATFVEVGAWKGRSTAYMAVEIANSGKKIDFFVVDTWRGSQEPEHLQDQDVINNRLYQVFLKNIKPAAKQIKAIRLPSTDAARLFKDESLDFVFLDADHAYGAVLSDIKAWLPKIKKGGIIAGDDYDWESVKKAVDEIFKNPKIQDEKGKIWLWTV